MENEGLRVNKFLSTAGVCSRREADRLIEAGRVQIREGAKESGAVPEVFSKERMRTAVPGDRVLAGERVFLDGNEITADAPSVILLFNKPRGIVCTTAKSDKDNIISYIDYPVRIYPIGRLDKDSRGLILLSNRGDLFDKIMPARNYHEKEYEVRLNRPYDEAFLKKMRAGVFLPALSRTTRPCHVTRVDETTFRIILTQGLNRQIRRMTEALGYRVTDLCRIRIMHLTLDGLPEGQYRRLTEAETEVLEALSEKNGEGAKRAVPSRKGNMAKRP